MDAQELDGLFNDHLIKRICDLNFPPNGLYAYVMTDVKPSGDRVKEALILAAAQNLGADLSKQEVREKLGTREPEDEADTLPAPNRVKPLGGDNMPNVPNSQQIPEQGPGNPGENGNSLSRRGSMTMTLNL